MSVFSAIFRFKRIIVTGVATGLILGLAIGSAGAASNGQLKSTINPYLIPPWLGTWSGLYLTPAEAFEAVRRPGVVFVDVRYGPVFCRYPTSLPSLFLKKRWPGQCPGRWVVCLQPPFWN